MQEPAPYSLDVDFKQHKAYRPQLRVAFVDVSPQVRGKRDPPWVTAASLQLDSAEQPENVLAREIERRRVRAAIDTLRPRQQHILTLHIVEQMTCKQIARATGLSGRMVLRELVRAHAQLRVLLADL